jgi:hypothetical protein
VSEAISVTAVIGEPHRHRGHRAAPGPGWQACTPDVGDAFALARVRVTKVMAIDAAGLDMMKLGDGARRKPPTVGPMAPTKR